MIKNSLDVFFIHKHRGSSNFSAVSKFQLGTSVSKRESCYNIGDENSSCEALYILLLRLEDLYRPQSFLVVQIGLFCLTKVHSIWENQNYFAFIFFLAKNVL